MRTSPYLGAPVDLVTGPQGQIANRELVDRREHIAPAIQRIADGVWSVVGLSVSNAHVIDAPDGLIVIDSGNGIDEGTAIRELIRTVSQRPIVALIYSHAHYVSGAAGVLADNPSVPIYAHARLVDNLSRAHANEAPAYHFRGLAQYGVPLPMTGPDANPIATSSSKKGALGYLPPTQTWATNGAVVTVAGENVQVFTDYSFDTDDSLIVWLPDRAVCCHNHVTATFPNMVSIAGGGYRDPVPWLAGLDRMLALSPAHLLGVHGLSTSGREAVQARLTAFRDALQFVYDQSVRGMNRGLTADELLSELALPAHLAADPSIAQSYAEWEFGVRGVYAGLLGWYSGDAVDLHPVPPQLESERILAGFGGLTATLQAVEQELADRCWAWAAKLARHAVRGSSPADPGHAKARELLAAALRAMGQSSPAWTTRNVYLTQAGEWEGSWDRRTFPPRLDPATAARTPPGTFVRALGFRLDPVASADRLLTIAIHFRDVDHRCGLQIRRGVAAYHEGMLAGAELQLICDRTDYLDWFFGRRSWAALAAAATVDGTAWPQALACFDAWPPFGGDAVAR